MSNDWLSWLKVMSSDKENIAYLNLARDYILSNAKLKPTDILLDIGTGMGLLAFEAYETLKDKGKVIASDISQNCLDKCFTIALKNGITKNFEVKLLDITDMDLPDECIDVIVGRSVLYITQ